MKEIPEIPIQTLETRLLKGRHLSTAEAGRRTKCESRAKGQTDRQTSDGEVIPMAQKVILSQTLPKFLARPNKFPGHVPELNFDCTLFPNGC